MNPPPAPAPAPTPPPVAKPPSKPDPVKDKLQADADAAIDAAFEGIDLTIEDQTPPAPKPAPPVTKAPEPKEEPTPKPEPDGKKEEPKSPDEKVDPLDAPPEGSEPPKPLTSKDLRSQLLVANKKIEEMTVAHAQRDTELETTRKEVETLRKQLEESSGYVPEKIDYGAQPSVKKYTDVINKDARVIALSMGEEGKKLLANFSGWLRQYILAANLDGSQGEEAVAKLTETLETELGERGRERTMELFGRSLPGYEAAMEEIKKLEADSHNIRTRQSLDQYNRISQEIKDVLTPMGDLPEDVMAAQPHDPATFIARNIASDPKWAARSMEAKQRIAEFLSGVKPLSPEEKAKRDANDTGGLTNVEEDQKKKYSEDRRLWAKRMYQGAMILPLFKSMYEELETLRAKHSEEEAELSALDKVDEKKVVPIAQPKKARVETADDFNKLLDDVFDGKEVPA